MRESAQVGLWFLDSIDRVNQAIAGTHELEQMMLDVLDVVLDVFDCDRAWLITPPVDSPGTFFPIAERTRPAYPGGLETGQHMPAPAALQAMHRDVMAAEGPLTFDEQQLAASGLFEALGVRAMIVVAIHPKQMQPYAFGLHQCSRPRTWTRDERELLVEIGHRIAVALNALLLFRELRASERRLIAAEELANIGYWDQDVGTRQVKLSAQAAKIFGLPPDRRVLTAEEFRDVVHEDDRERVAKEARDALLANRVLDVEGRVTRADGAIRLIHTRARLVADDDGQVQHVFGTAQDVTEQRLEQVEQHEIEVRFRAFVDHATDALFLLDSSGRVIDVNESACESLGYTRAELLGMSPTEFNIDAIPGFETDLAERFAREDTFTFDSLQRRKDGSTFPVEVRMRQFWEGGRRIVALARDITKRKQAEDQLRASEERFRRMIENASDLISVINRDGVFRFQSPAVKRMLGYEPEEMLGKTCIEFVHPDDRAKKQEALARATAAPGTPIMVEQRVRHADGRWRLFQTVAQSLPANGDEGYIVLNSRDLTDARQLEEQLRQAQKMDAIGQLAGGIAHDFNTILAAIMMQTGLSNVPGVPDEVKENLEQIQLAAQRAAELTRQLLLFSRRQLLQPRDVDLNELVKSLAKMLQRLIGETVVLKLDLDSAPLVTRADPGMIDQLLMNLAINSRDAMPDGGALSIQTRVRATEQGRSIAIRVHDSGAGIAPDVLPHIFEPFFTTKEAGKGTGLGLATVFGIVQQHQGTIDVSSTPGDGTTFDVTLPFVGRGEVEPVLARSTPPGGHELVLVVEDDEVLRRTTKRTLERAGYRTVDAASGREAVQLWEKLAEKPALLLTDLVMPGLSGHQVAAMLRAWAPNMRVLFISGYSAEIAGRELELRSGENFVQKPFAQHVLLEAVRRCLDS